MKITRENFLSETRRLIAEFLASEDPYGWIGRNRALLITWLMHLVEDTVSNKRESIGRTENRSEDEDPIVEEVWRLLDVVSRGGLVRFVAEEELDPDYLTDLLGYTGGAVFLVFALIAAEGLAQNREEYRDLPERVRKTLDRVLDEAVMLLSEVEMLKRIKEEDEGELRKIAAVHEVKLHE